MVRDFLKWMAVLLSDEWVASKLVSGCVVRQKTDLVEIQTLDQGAERPALRTKFDPATETGRDQWE